MLTLLSGVTPTFQGYSAEVASLVSERAPLLFCRGEQRILAIPGLLRFSLGSEVLKTILKTKAMPEDSILIKAVTAGNGDLWVWKKDGSIERRLVRVSACRTTMAGPVESAVAGLQETEIHLSGEGAVLRGVIQSQSEAARIRAVLNAFPNKIRDETRPSEGLLQSELQEIKQWLTSVAPQAVLTAEILGTNVRIRGNVDNAHTRGALEKEIASRFVLARAELSSLPDISPTIYFRVFLLELKKDRFGSIGLSWPGSTPNAFRVTTAGIPKFEDLLQLDLSLEALEGDGSLKVLSRPEMAVRAPGEAELFAGGELPIASRGRYSSNVAWKPYGLTLKLKVTHATESQVRLEIFTEVSQLDTNSAAEAIPGIRSNRMKTQIDARFGAPLLLSGLLQERNRENARGLPLLRRIPVLGSLFGSSDYLQDRSELVAILLPLRAPPPAPKVSPKSVARKADVTLNPGISIRTQRFRRVHRVFPYREGTLRRVPLKRSNR